MGIQLTFAESTAIVIGLTAVAEISIQAFRYFAARSTNKALIPLAVVTGDCSEHLERAMDRQRRWWIRWVAMFALLARLFYMVVPDIIQNQTSQRSESMYSMVDSGSARAEKSFVAGDEGVLPDITTWGVVGDPFNVTNAACTFRIATSRNTTNMYVSVAPQPGVRIWCSDDMDPYSDRVTSGNLERYNLTQPVQTLGSYFIYQPGKKLKVLKFNGTAAVSGTTIGINSNFASGRYVDLVYQNNYAEVDEEPADTFPKWNRSEQIETTIYTYLKSERPRNLSGFAWEQQAENMASLLTYGAYLVDSTQRVYVFEYQQYIITAETVRSRYEVNGTYAIAVAGSELNATVARVREVTPLGAVLDGMYLFGRRPDTVYNPIVVIVIMTPIIGAFLILTIVALIV